MTLGLTSTPYGVTLYGAGEPKQQLLTTWGHQMGTAAEAEVVNGEEQEEGDAMGATGELTITAPDGAEFEMEEVKTAKGTKTLGQVPILTWRVLDKARDYFGDEGIMDILDGTSLRVSYQNIGRRYAQAGKTVDEIAEAQVKFRPGKRAAGVSTPVSRAGNAARRAAEKMGDQAENITAFLERVAKGEIPEEQLKALGLKA